jgi:hypothetical protein
VSANRCQARPPGSAGSSRLSFPVGVGRQEVAREARCSPVRPHPQGGSDASTPGQPKDTHRQGRHDGRWMRVLSVVLLPARLSARSAEVLRCGGGAVDPGRPGWMVDGPRPSRSGVVTVVMAVSPGTPRHMVTTTRPATQ